MWFRSTSPRRLRLRNWGFSVIVIVLAAIALSAVGGRAVAADHGEQAKGNLTVVIPNEPGSLNFDLDNHLSTLYIRQLDVENLIASNPSNFNATHSGLLVSWKAVNRRTWSFGVRQGVSFTDGERFTAATAAWDINHEIKANNPFTGPYIVDFKHASAKGRSLIITTKRPLPYLPQILTLIQAIPPHYFQQKGNQAFGQRPVGTGPFMFKSWTPGQRLVFARNPHYYGPKAKLKTLTFTFASEGLTRLNLLKTGGADIASNLAVADAPAGHGYTVQNVHTPLIMQMNFNVHSTPFTHRSMRLAAVEAISRSQLVKAAFGPKGAQPYADLMPPYFKSSGHHKKVIKYNLAAAKAAVAKANHPSIDVYWTSDGHYVDDARVGQIVSGMLQAAGFRVTQHPLETGAFFTQLYTNKMPGISIWGGEAVFHNEAVEYQSAYGTKDAVLTYCLPPAVIHMFSKAVTLPNGAKRNHLYNEMEQNVDYKTLCGMNLFMARTAFAVSNQVRGFHASQTGLWSSLVNTSVG